VCVVEVERGTVSERVGTRDGPAGGNLRPFGRAVSYPYPHVPFELVGRIFRTDDDRSAYGVAAIEGTLGPFKDLDLGDVEQLLVEFGRIGLEHTVHQHGNRGLAVARLRYTAHHHERRTGVLRLHQGHVRHERDEVAGFADSGRLDGLLRKHTLGNRYVAHRLVALARRDDDLFQTLHLCPDRQCGQSPEHSCHRPCHPPPRCVHVDLQSVL
jgi:hypothetical protein